MSEVINNCINEIRKENDRNRAKILRLQNFYGFDMSIGLQLKVIQDTPLRYEREFLKEWVTDIFHRVQPIEIEITPNPRELRVTYQNNITITFPLYQSNLIKITSREDYKKMHKLNEGQIMALNLKKDCIEEFFKKPSFKGYKGIINNSCNFLRWIFEKKDMIEEVKRERRAVRGRISNYRNYEMENNFTIPDHNKKLRENREKFLDLTINERKEFKKYDFEFKLFGK